MSIERVACDSVRYIVGGVDSITQAIEKLQASGVCVDRYEAEWTSPHAVQVEIGQVKALKPVEELTEQDRLAIAISAGVRIESLESNEAGLKLVLPSCKIVIENGEYVVVLRAKI